MPTTNNSTGGQFDFIVIGGGINGLTAACYLSRAGLSILVLEKQAYFGGGAITQEITLPGFKHDVFATSINVWRMGPVQTDLELEKYGYKDLDPDPVASTPFESGKALSIYKNVDLTLKSISQFSEKDARKFGEFYKFYLDSKDILHSTLYNPPVRFSDTMATLEESDEGLDFLQFSYMSARDWLEENFESEEVKAFFALWASNHSPLSPEEPRGALLALGFVGSLQDAGVGVPIGGMKTLADSLCAYIVAHGGMILSSKEILKIITDQDGKALGVKTSDGSLFQTKRGIVANTEPKSLFLKLIDENALDSGFRNKVKSFRFSKVSEVMIHAALDDWLNYRPGELSRSGMVQVGESLDQISRAYNDCVVGAMPEEPFMTIDNTTYYDSSRAPKGKHIMWNFARAPTFLHGKPWTEDDKERFAERCLDKLSEYAPNTKKIILKRIVMSPQDIEFLNTNLVNADSGGGKPSLDQSLTLRPFPGWSEYRTPIKNLYICGSSTHPGGGVSGAPGHNAAMVILSDLGITSAL